MELLLFIAAIAGLCVVSFFVGLMTWFVIFRRSALAWLRQIRTMLIGFTLFAAVFVLFAGLLRYAVAFDRLSQDVEQRAWLVLAPVAVTGILSAHTLALHLRVRRLEHNVA
jgi:hypothetical protein